MQVNVETKYLLALLHFAAKADIRTCLNAVRVEASARGTILVGCDGQKLGVIRSEEKIEEGPESFVIQVPREVVESLKKAGPMIQLASADGKTWTATDTLRGASHRWVDDCLKYPDWRRVVPDKTSGVAAQFSPDKMTATAAAAAALGVKTRYVREDAVGAAFLIAQNGGDGALVQIRDTPEFVGVLMPYRAERIKPVLRTEAPSWVRGLPTEETSDLA